MKTEILPLKPAVTVTARTTRLRLPHITRKVHLVLLPSGPDTVHGFRCVRPKLQTPPKTGCITTGFKGRMP